MISLDDRPGCGPRGAGPPVPNSDASHCGTNAWQKSSTSQKPRRSDPTSSPPSLSDGGLPQKAFQSQSLNRAKTPYPGYTLTNSSRVALAAEYGGGGQHWLCA